MIRGHGVKAPGITTPTDTLSERVRRFFHAPP